MTVPLARRNLLSEKGRFAISVAGVGFAVLLILIVIALYRGFSHSGQTFKELPGDLWVVQQGTTDPFHSLSLLDSERVASVRDTSGVASAIPVLSRQMEFSIGDDKPAARFLALDLPASTQLPDKTRESYAPAPGRVVIDRTLSRKTGLSAGDTIVIGGEKLAVDHVRSAGGESFQQFVFMSFSDAQRIFGVHDIVNYVMVIVSPGADPKAVAAAISDRDPRVSVFTADGFAKAVRKEINESFLPIIAILVAIGFVVGAAVVGLTIYTATIERSREYGVMKAVGGSPGLLYRVVLSQSIMLTGAGFVVGLGAAVGVARLAAGVVPEFATDFQPTDILGVLVAAGFMAILASFVPVRRINSIDPAMVFKA
jgi:putative ABC transport system permease protein